MRLETAKTVAADRAKREKRKMVVAYDEGHQSPGWRHRYIVYPEGTFYAHKFPVYYVTPKGTVIPIHHHTWTGNESGHFVGLKRNCPYCHPRKRGCK